MNVSLELATPALLPIVHHFFLAFFYDLSAFDPNIAINAYGLPTWAPAGLPGPRTPAEFIEHNWWIRGSCDAYVIRADAAPAGYLMVCRERSHIPPEIDQELLDFYIAPPYRRKGIGRRAAQAVFERHRGTWQVNELLANTAARTFWQVVIDEYTGGKFENLDEGTQQQFTLEDL